MRAVAIAVMAALPFVATAQTLYKWVDEKGVTHYSEKPPEKGSATRVEVRTAEGGKAAPAEDWKEKERQFRERRVQREQQEREEAAKKERDEQGLARRCRDAQRHLDGLKNARRVYELDAKGERVYLEDNERPARIEKWQREADATCK